MNVIGPTLASSWCLDPTDYFMLPFYGYMLFLCTGVPLFQAVSSRQECAHIGFALCTILASAPAINTSPAILQIPVLRCIIH